MTGSEIVQEGRGAWPGNGAGGTLSTDGTKPGRYYVLRSGDGPLVGALGTQWPDNGDVGTYAVNRAVYHIQRLLAKARYRTTSGLPLPVTGAFDIHTFRAVKLYQSRVGLATDGVFGPKTSQHFFLPTVKAAYNSYGLDWKLGYGLVTTESAWDPGAVGYIDSNDLGLCQINGPAHPEMDLEARLDPELSLVWQARQMSYLQNSLGTLRDAVAAYNLGLGGARQWVKAGRPDLWVPPFDKSGRERDVAGYIDSILGAADRAGVS